MRSIITLTTLALTASCASSGSSPRGGEIVTPAERVVATDNRGTYRTTVAPNAKVPVPAAASRVFEAVRAVYQELGIPSGIDDAATGRIGNTDFWKTRKLGNEPMSTYLNCGDSVIGSAADNYRIYISLVSVVRPATGGTSELETAFVARAQNMEGTASDRVACGTTGRLEDLIQRNVLRKVGAPQ